jgi:hypothetical protein
MQMQWASNGQGTKLLDYINMGYINIQDGTILVIAKIMPHTKFGFIVTNLCLHNNWMNIIKLWTFKSINVSYFL